MRSLLQPGVLKSASVAALITSLICFPRLAMWRDRSYQLWFLVLTLAWASFILWSFVYGWSPQTARRPILPIRPILWSAATATGLVGALVLRLFIDSVLLPLVPGDYPDSYEACLSMTLFTLGFDQLFLCFAPFAFFVRLMSDRRAAAGLTVLFGVVLLGLRIESLGIQLSAVFIAGLFAWRIAAGLLTLYFYLKGGPSLVWWCALLMQLRHLVTLTVPTW